jgi:hypothetical protein
MREAIEELKRRFPENTSQSCSESRNTNVQDSVTGTTGANEEPKQVGKTKPSFTTTTKRALLPRTTLHVSASN